ncbi:MAG: efflux RND transporter periplasmic adaptor subunit [Patescibacteria group bacterium]
MRSILSKIVLFIKTRKVLSATIAILVIAFLFFIFMGNGSPANTFVAVAKGTITQEVSVTGKIKPVSSVTLAFERSGRIISVGASVGDKINAGKVLASIDTSELYAQILQAQADLQAQKAKLRELENGSRPEEISISEAQFESAKTSLENARRGVIDALNNAYTSADDSVRNKADKFFSNSRGLAPTLNLTTYEPQLKTDIENLRPLIESNFSAWKTYLNTLNMNKDLYEYTENSFPYLNAIKNMLDKMALVVNSMSVDSYKTDISSARTEISSAITNIYTAREKLNTSESNYVLAQKNLDLKKAGYLPEQISAQESQVNRADANAQLIQAQISKSSVVAPISGIITKQDAKVGEIASAFSPIISIMSESAMEIEANIPEVDMAKISIGNSTKITLDAIQNETFSGKVTYIDPAETIIDGVVNFKIKAVMEAQDPRVKSGLTANLDIATLSKNDALVLPQYAIIENDSGTFVKRAIVKPGSSALANITSSNVKTEEIPVKLGLSSADGMVEILSGLSEGDQILNIGIKSK